MLAAKLTEEQHEARALWDGASPRAVRETGRSKPNEQGSIASRQAQQDDHCELWIAYSPVHQLVKKTFLTS